MGCSKSKDNRVAAVKTSTTFWEHQPTHGTNNNNSKIHTSSTENIEFFYEFTRTLGKNKFGTTKEAVRKTDTATPKKRYAVKILPRYQHETQTRREVMNLIELDHPGICTFYETYIDNQNVYLVMEYCEGGSLSTQPIHSRGEAFVAKIIFDLVSAVHHMHSMQIIHRNLNLKNLLFTDTSQKAVKIINLGYSCNISSTNSKTQQQQLNRALTKHIGLDVFAAPEVLNTSTYGAECDVWSLGVIAFCLLSGEMPFASTDDAKHEAVDFSSHAWHSISKAAKHAISKMLEPSSKKRVTIAKLLKEEWFKLMQAQQLKGEVVDYDLDRLLVEDKIKNYGNANLFKQICMKILVKHAKDEDLAAARQAFESMDKDKNGNLEKNEFRALIDEQKYFSAQSKKNVNLILQLLFRSADGQHDVTVKYSDFLAATLDDSCFSQSSIKALFNYLDTDNNGFLDFEDLVNIMAREGQKIDEEQAKGILDDYACFLKEGKLYFEDFYGLMVKDQVRVKERIRIGASSSAGEITPRNKSGSTQENTKRGSVQVSQQGSHIPLTTAPQQQTPPPPTPPTKPEEPRLSQFFDNDELSDITLIDGARTFRCHKIILASKSAFFRTRFKASPSLSEFTLPERSIISIETYNPMLHVPAVQSVDIIVAVLKFLYSDYDFSILISNGLTTSNCLDFFAYFCDLDITSGIFLIERFILQYYIAPENCLSLLNVGLQFQNNSFIENASKLAAEKLGKLLKLDANFYQSLLQLSFPAFYAIVSSNDVQLDSEDILLSLVHDYIESASLRPPILDSAVAALEIVAQEQQLKPATDILAQNIEGSPPPQIDPSIQAPTEVPTQLQSEQPAQSAADPVEPNPPQQPSQTEAAQPIEASGETPVEAKGEAGATNVASATIDPTNQIPVEISAQAEVKQADIIPTVDFYLNRFKELPIGPLSESEIAELLKQVRLGYVSHSALTHFCNKVSFNSQKDVFFKAISLKLSQYEATQQPAQQYEMLNWNPRESYFHKVNNLHPAVLATSHNLSASVVPTFKRPGTAIGLNIPTQQSTLTVSHVIEKAIIPRESTQLSFTYSSDFDENGMLYYLGTRNKQQEFSNPFYQSEIMPFCSSLKTGRIEDLTARLPVNTICTENEKNSFFGFDLGEERYLFPTCYTLRNRSSPSNVMYNWLLEGSNDNIVWHEIDRRIHFSKDAKFNMLMESERELLRKPSKSTTWGVDTKKLKDSLKKIAIDVKGFRVFRITQLSQNGNNTHEFALGAIEFYGKAFGTQWANKSAA